MSHENELFSLLYYLEKDKNVWRQVGLQVLQESSSRIVTKRDIINIMAASHYIYVFFIQNRKIFLSISLKIILVAISVFPTCILIAPNMIDCCHSSGFKGTGDD
ncbi:hypothetical protein ACJX0J_032719 [Zea mays]